MSNLEFVQKSPIHFIFEVSTWNIFSDNDVVVIVLGKLNNLWDIRMNCLLKGLQFILHKLFMDFGFSNLFVRNKLDGYLSSCHSAFTKMNLAERSFTEKLLLDIVFFSIGRWNLMECNEIGHIQLDILSFTSRKSVLMFIFLDIIAV